MDDYDNGGQQSIAHRNTDLAFSPNAIAALVLKIQATKNFNISITSKYVGKQFLDNTSDATRQLDAYYVTNINMNYTLKNKIGKELTFGILMNNIFNHLYENNGYTFSYLYGGSKTTENFYYPQAGFNILGRINLKF